MPYQPRLYIIMRKDIAQMNPGKAIAQGAHAQADFSEWATRTVNAGDADDSSNMAKERAAMIRNWKNQAVTFGTTLVLHETIETMWQIGENMSYAAIITDPTYPMKNHYDEPFTVSEETAMWAFPVTDAEFEYMMQFKLHP